MKLTPKIQKAINVAAVEHHGQHRRGIRRPYIVHPFSVAFVLSEFTDDEDVIVAALLHDVLEDSHKYTYNNMKREFGRRVVRIVKEVSEDKEEWASEDKKASWERRKLSYLNKLKTDSREALLVSAADKIHNLLAMIEAYEEKGETVWQKFNAPVEKRLWYYGEVLRILQARLDNNIVGRFEKIYGLTCRFFGKEREIIFKLIPNKAVRDWALKNKVKIEDALGGKY